jgi:hypothetical protein
MLHAYRNAIDVIEQDDGLDMYIGPGYNAAMLEVGIAYSEDQGAVVVHADKARENYRR